MLPKNLYDSPRQRAFVLLFYGAFAAAFVALGFHMRWDQWTTQLLADDEWHALLWISKYSALKTFLSFGVSDHSIPMALYDALVSKFTPLNENWMRAPSMVAGIALLLLGPWLMFRGHVREGAVVTALIAVSPLLIYFSRIARPYAASLLLAYIAHWAFWRYWTNPRWHWLLLYACSGALATWLLSLAGFFVIAPFLYVLTLLLRRETAQVSWAKVLRLATAFGVAAGAVLLPPLLSSLTDLAAKAGRDVPTLDTWVNVWFTWFGTRSSALVTLLGALAALGLPTMMRGVPIARSALLGCGLVLLAVYIAQPAESFRAITFGRYLIFALPLVLLSAAFGLVRVNDMVRLPKACALGLAALLALAVFKTSHLPEQLRPNNAYTLSAYYYMDPRPAMNPALKTMGFPMSQFWPQLKAKGEPVRVAVAPFYFESYYWPVVRWSKLSGQQIIPMFINGFCVPDYHPGEPPFIARQEIKLNNGIYLAEANIEPGLFKSHQLDWIVWQKSGSRPEVPYTPDFSRCDLTVPAALGKPEFEDDYLMAFRVK